MMQVKTDDEVLLAKPCTICGQLDRIESTLVYDMCHNVARVYCLGLTAVPLGFWCCPACFECIEKSKV